MKTKQLTIDAMLAALCTILGYIALDFGSIKITLEGYPVILAGLMYGPVDGLLTGIIGTFLYQFLRYGLTVTTALWILPYAAAGFLAGLIARKSHFNNSPRQLGIIIFLLELVILIFNTVAIYADAKIFGYYTPVLIYGALLSRFAVAVLKAVVFAFITPRLLKRMSRITGNGR